MRLICPACGAIASAETWLNDGVCREVLARITGLPAPLPKVALGYLGLFRPGERGLTWKKALQLADEITALVAVGYVSVAGKVDRDCGPVIWAQAMEQMIEQRGRLRLPMKNHNYLRQIAWEIADSEDRRNESTARNKQGRPLLRTHDPLEKARQEYDEKLASGQVDPFLRSMLERVGRIDEDRG